MSSRAASIFHFPLARSRRARVRCCQLSLAVFLALLWLSVTAHLAIHWRSNPEYHYAWAIPALVAAVLLTRLRRFDTRAVDASRLPTPVATTLGIGALLALVPLAIIARANPDWHLISCLLTASACLLTLLAFDTYGGKSFRIQFGLPLLLMFAATPWPYAIESSLVNFLKSANAASTLEILHFCGVSALRETPHVIQLTTAQLGIEDGCSGIRSLHLFLALTLFWGELYQLAIRFRILLVGIGLILTLVTNLGRTLVLATLATTGGAERFDRWHDLVGTVAQLVAVTLCCVALNWFLSRKRPRSRNRAPATPRRFRSDRRGTMVFASASLWLVIAGIGSAAWFKVRPQAVSTDEPWSLRWPPPMYECRVESLPGTWEKMMSPDEAFSGSWRNQNGRRRVLYYFRWEPGNHAARLGTAHNPELCLAGSGGAYTLKGKNDVTVEFAGRERAFTRYRFQYRNRELFIFQGVWEDSQFADNPEHTPDQIGSRSERLRRAWHGLPHPGQRMLEFVFWDSSDAEKTAAELQIALKSLVSSQFTQEN